MGFWEIAFLVWVVGGVVVGFLFGFIVNKEAIEIGQFWLAMLMWPVFLAVAISTYIRGSWR